MFDMGEDEGTGGDECPHCEGCGLRSQWAGDGSVIMTVICECPAGVPFRRDRDAAEQGNRKNGQG